MPTDFYPAIPSALSERRFGGHSLSPTAGLEGRWVEQGMAEIKAAMVVVSMYHEALAADLAHRSAELARAVTAVAVPDDEAFGPVPPKASRRAFLTVVSRRKAEPAPFDTE